MTRKFEENELELKHSGIANRYNDQRENKISNEKTKPDKQKL